MPTLDLHQAAALLRAHPETVRAGAAAGSIPGAKVGRAWVFIEADLLDYLRQHYKTKAPTCDSTNAATPGGRISDAATAKALARQTRPRPSAGRNVVPLSFGNRPSSA